MLPWLAGFVPDCTLTSLFHHTVAFFLDASGAISSCVVVLLCTLLDPVRGPWVVLSDGGLARTSALPLGL